MNRHERRARDSMKKSPGYTPTRIIPAPPKDKTDPMLGSMQDLTVDERVRLIVTGKAPPPSDVVDYLVTQYKAARAEYEAMESMKLKLERQLDQIKDKVLVLQGGVNKYLEDITFWTGKAYASSSPVSNRQRLDVEEAPAVSDQSSSDSSSTEKEG